MSGIESRRLIVVSIDFEVLPGLVGLNLMGSGMWGLGFSIVQARTRKIRSHAEAPARLSPDHRRLDGQRRRITHGGAKAHDKAEDLKLRRIVALKFLSPHARENQDRRFLFLPSGITMMFSEGKMKVLVINTGSSSLKYRLFEMDGVVSRKKQLIPYLTDLLKEMHSEGASPTDRSKSETPFDR